MNLDDMIASERSAPAKATETQTLEVWRSIEHSFVSVIPAAGAPAAAAKASTLGKLGGALSSTAGKLLLATTLVTGGAVATSRLSAENDDAPVAAERSTTDPEMASVAAPVAPPAPPTPPQSMPSPAPAPAPQPQRAMQAEPEQAAPEAKPARVRPAAKPKSSVKEELALIQRTQSALRSGAHKRALTLARQHATTYPDGAFVEDREALRALALCESSSAKAPGAASKFIKRWPKSMHRSRIEAACE